jgi:hypothetical protein
VSVGGDEDYVMSTRVIDEIRLFLYHVLHVSSLRQLAVEGLY